MATDGGGATNTPALYGVSNSQRHERKKNMDIIEVIKTLETQLTDIAEKCGPKVGTAVQEAIGACKKEVPRSLVNYGAYGCARNGYCPSCNNLISTIRTTPPEKRCDICGQAYDWQLSRCIHNHCDECQWRSINELTGNVCKHYADKADEIMRLHAEGTAAKDTDPTKEGENSV